MQFLPNPLVLLGGDLDRTPLQFGPLTTMKIAAIRSMIRAAVPRQMLRPPRWSRKLEPIVWKPQRRSNDRAITGPTGPSNRNYLDTQCTKAANASETSEACNGPKRNVQAPPNSCRKENATPARSNTPR
jgi:hypothetical protein